MQSLLLFDVKHNFEIEVEFVLNSVIWFTISTVDPAKSGVLSPRLHATGRTLK